MATHWRGWLFVVGGLGGVVLAIAVALSLGSYGDCRKDTDCGQGQACMEWTSYSRPWWARRLTVRTCATPCEKDSDCPSTHTCVWTDHGPGPGRHCALR